MRGFDVEQYLLSPVQLGIPNSRLRYYCLASTRATEDKGRIVAIQETLPQDSLPSTTPSIPMASAQEGEGSTLHPLSEYLVSHEVAILVCFLSLPLRLGKHTLHTSITRCPRFGGHT